MSSQWAGQPVNKVTELVVVRLMASVAMAAGCEVIVLTFWFS